MLKPIEKNFKGLTIISGPTKSGKSQLAEFLIKEQESITYIATSKPRINDQEWQRRINVHKRRRPSSWKLIEHPLNICKSIERLGVNESVLIDSLGGLVEQHLIKNDYQWELFQVDFVNCLIKNDYGFFLVTEEIGWGVIPSTPIGHLFRERLSNLSSLLCRHSTNKWLAVHGTAIDLDRTGYPIP